MNSKIVEDVLPTAVFQELVASVRGDVYPRDDDNFVEYAKLFNGNVLTLAKAVVCPLDAKDVSRTILFCKKHSLSPSVKAGGYGTAGWAIGGDIIIDLSKIVGVDLEPPQPEGGYTSLHTHSPSGKGKDKPSSSPKNPSPSTTGKRRRQDDEELRTYDNASSATAGFLRGPPLEESADGPSPSTRRRLEPPAPARRVSIESSSSGATSSRSQGSRRSESQIVSSNNSTGDTTPSPAPKPPTNNVSASSASRNPFGYMNLDSRELYQPSTPSRYMYRSLGPGVNPSFANASMVASYSDDNTRAIPIHPHAYVTFGAGVRQKEIDQYTAAHPLEAKCLSGARGEIPYHVPFAAHPVGSAVMILGGFGFQTRLRGFSIDNLVEVEMVLADGRIVIVNERENADLWWAVRGAGSAFGVATRYKAKAYPLPLVFAGNLIYRFHRATAPSLIKHFRDCIKGAPRELYANVLLTAGPAGKDSLVVIQLCYLGPKEKGQEYLQAISSWDGERCLLNEVHEKSFLHQQDSVAQVLRGKAGRQWFIRSALITSLPDDIINQTVMKFSTGPVGCTWLFELAGGALTDHEDTCIPKSQREASFNIVALHQWDMNIKDDRCRSTAEEWISGTLLPVNCGGPIPTFLGRHEPPARAMESFGANWDRLKELKKQYDPTGMFRNSFWPLDSQGRVMKPEEHEPPSPY